jgi:PAS domain S-box-containing protein
MLQKLIEGTQRLAGTTFLQALVVDMSKVFPGTYAQVGHLIDSEHIHAEPCAIDGELIAPIDYPIVNTPCAHVVGAKTQYWPEKLPEQFAEDAFLHEHGYQSYLGSPMFDSNGQPNGLLSLLSKHPLKLSELEIAAFSTLALRAGADLERSRVLAAQGKNEEAQARLAAIVESSQDAIMGANLEGVLSTWNAAAERLFGFSSSEAIGQPVESLIVPEEHRGEAGRFIERVRQGAVIDNYDTVRIAKDGRRIPVAISVSPIRDTAGKISGVSAIIRDNSERKRWEEEQRHASQRKDEFLATLAHELRNPLAPIRHSLDLMRLSGPKDAMTMHTLDTMDRQVGHLVRLVDDLLDVSRITSGRVEIRREPVAIKDIVASAVETSLPLLENHGHVFEQSIPTEPVHVDGDLTRLAQIVANLLNNAARYTPPGGKIALKVECANELVTLTVKDNGVGIPKEMLDRVFDMFTQVKMPAAGREGLGIGLALVRRLVELHGGVIEARSDGAGQGSEFCVTMPLSDGPGPVENRAPIERARTPLSKWRRILVVDDEEDIRSSLAELLRVDGHDVSVASDGLEAIAIAEQSRFDVVLLDIGLPKLDGYQVAQTIRGKPWGQRLTLVAVTGWGQDEDRRRCRDAGFDHHLVKPVNLRSLRSLLAAVPARPV